MAIRSLISALLSPILVLALQGSAFAQKAEGPKTISVIRLSPTEAMGTVQGLPGHEVHGTLKTQPPPPPPVDLEEREEKQPEVPVIESGINIPPQQTTETGIGAIRQAQASGSFSIFRNSSLAPVGFTGNVSEPNVGSQGDGIFMTHNWYAEVSTNNGSSFSYISPYTTFPKSPAAFSAGFCCDQRVAQDSSRDLIFWYLQYIKTGSTSSSTNGVRLAVTHGQAGLAASSWSYYDFTPSLFGLPAGTWLDFPQMQTSANYLYFTTNVYNAVGDSFYGAAVARIPLSQLASGSSITFNYFTVVGSYGSITPVNGAAAEGTRPGRTTMYFAARDTSTSIKVIVWPESSTLSTVNTVSGLASTSAATYACPGPGGLDPCTRANGRMQTGWITDSELGFMWNSSQNGSSRPYPYIRVVILNPSTLAVISQPDIFGATSAWLYPAVSVNERGHLAGTADYLGGTQYPTIAAMIRDDLSPDPSINGWEVYAVASSNSGTAGLYGDYNGSMPHEKYPKTWLAAGHTQVGGSADSNAVVHSYWFGRERDNPIQPCYTLTRAHTGSGSDPTASPGNSSGCSAGQYHAGEVIALTASPSVNWNVGSWSGTSNNGSTSTSNTLTMPASNQTVTVNYVQAPPTCYTLTRTHTGSGSDPSASPANSSGCSSGQYTAGAVIQLTASPAAGWNVGSWSGTSNNGSTSTSNTLTMPASNQTVTVNYVQAPPTCYTLTRTHIGSGSDPSASPANSTGCSSGQYTAGAVIQLTASPASGWSVANWSGTNNNGSTSTSNTTTMPAGSRAVTVNYAQIPSSAILLVDDDDNDPDVRSYYTAALSALGKPYDVWDTGNTDTEPGAVALQAYQTVIWFSGGSYGGAAGPGASGEADLATFLSGGSRRCMILSSQDYFYDRGPTSFMVNYLGLGTAANDVSQSSVLGQGSAFSGLGSYALAFPFSNFSDLLLPGAGAEAAFSGDQGGAAVSRIGANHRTIYLGFPFEALPTSQARQEVMAAALDFCSTVFADVPPKYWARKFIEAIYRAGVTNGCAQSPLRYCPEEVVTRGSMAQMLIAAKEGPNYVPPPCTASPFSDVPASSPICPWVQELVRRGVTAGCGGGQYCPNNPVTRSQMSVFLLSTWHGAGYAPTQCAASAYNDVPRTSPFCPWIQEMAARGITAGCGGGAFCTESPNTRAQLAVFLATTFGLPLQ